MRTTPPMSRGDQAFRFLQDAIESGRLVPGTRLLELELAAQLDLSRTPIREALNRLEAEGLVMHQPGRGLVVTQLDHAMVSEIYTVREMLEGTAARLAARHASEVEISILREIAGRDQALVGNPEKLAVNNRFFHENLCRCAHNRHLLRILKSLQGVLTLLGRTTLAIPGRASASVVEHQALIQALERRDSDAAEAIVRAHIQAAYKARLTTIMPQ